MTVLQANTSMSKQSINKWYFGVLLLWINLIWLSPMSDAKCASVYLLLLVKAIRQSAWNEVEKTEPWHYIYPLGTKSDIDSIAIGLGHFRRTHNLLCQNSIMSNSFSQRSGYKMEDGTLNTLISRHAFYWCISGSCQLWMGFNHFCQFWVIWCFRVICERPSSSSSYFISITDSNI